MTSRHKNHPVTTLADDPSLGAVPTGSLALDLALGTGGWPRGRIVEVHGAPGSGKTTLLLHAIASAQKAGGMAALIDADHGVSQSSAARLGIDLERMPYHRTNCLEEVFAKVEELAKSGSVDVIALDSIAALVPKGYLDSPPGDYPLYQNQNFQHLIETCLKCVLGPLSRSRAVLLVTNQFREKVGVVYGSPVTIPWATLPLHDFASQRVEMRGLMSIKDGDSAIGSEVRAKVIKNRLATPLAVAEFSMYFSTGLSFEGDLIALGLDTKVLTKRGHYLFFGDRNIGNGILVATGTLQQDAELAARIKDSILERRQS